MTLEASRRERQAVASQTELEGSLYGLRPSRDAAQPDAARGLGSLMGGGRVSSRSSSANSYQQRVVIVRVHRATMHGDGARALAAAVEANRVLERLSLMMNGIGEAAAKAMHAAVEGNDVLRYVNVRENNVGDPAIEALKRLETMRPNLRIDS